MNLKYAKIIGILILSLISCHSPYVVKNVSQISNFQTNEKRYLNKPVSYLMKDLKVDILSIRAILGYESQNFLIVHFDNDKDFLAKSKKDSIQPASLTIFLNETDEKYNHLFLGYKATDSTKEYRPIKRSQELNTNKKMLFPYRNFTISMIYSRSEIKNKP